MSKRPPQRVEALDEVVQFRRQDGHGVSGGERTRYASPIPLDQADCARGGDSSAGFVDRNLRTAHLSFGEPEIVLGLEVHPELPALRLHCRSRT
jgi:hypothetical protein